jgi:hypothetical protein
MNSKNPLLGGARGGFKVQKTKDRKIKVEALFLKSIERLYLYYDK